MSVNYASSSQWRANASNEIMWPRCQHDGAKRQGTPVAEDLLVSCVVRIAAFCDNARQNCLGDKGRKAAAFVANAVSIAQGRHTVADPESVADKVGNQRRLLSPDEQQEAMASTFVKHAHTHSTCWRRRTPRGARPKRPRARSNSCSTWREGLRLPSGA